MVVPVSAGLEHLTSQLPDKVLNASGSWGCGAFVEDSLAWFQLCWPQSWIRCSIAVKELFPIVVAAAVWGDTWSSHGITFRCDNQAVVAALSSRSV